MQHTLPFNGRMPVDRIEDFQAFVAIVDKGSLTAAAKQLGRSLQSISRSLATLEGDLGVELIVRTTRRSAATEAGLAFYRRVGALCLRLRRQSLRRRTADRSPSGCCVSPVQRYSRRFTS